MSDEEKKGMDYFRNKICDFELFYGKKITTQENEYLKILLNLIEKQQKEIEELKKPKYLFNANTGEITRIDKTNDYITKDKIKSKIEELEKELEDIESENINKDEISKTTFYFIDRLKCKIEVLQSLIETE